MNNNQEKKWLADYIVESGLTIKSGESELVYKHPKNMYEAHLSNILGGNQKSNILSLQIITSAPNINLAEELVKIYSEQFLHTLSFVTGMGYKISRKICLIDWSLGISERELFQYTDDNSEEFLNDSLNQELLTTVKLLHQFEKSDVLDASLHWYAAGVRSKIIENQFQFFWFVIELIANERKSAKKVTDKCQKCRGDLHCKSCDELSMHKPFPKQLIEELLKNNNLTEDLIKDLFLIRNELSHGTSRKNIEKAVQKKSPEFSFDKAVNLLGKFVRIIIFRSLKGNQGKHEFKLLEPNSFVDWSITAKAHMILGIGGDPNNPKLKDIRLPQVSISTKDKPS